MHHNLISTRMLSLLAIGGVCCLLTSSAHAQRGGHRGANRASASATTGTATTGTTGSTTRADCPQSGSATGTTTTGTTGTTTTGTTTTGTTTTGTTSAVSAFARSVNSQSAAQTTALASGTVSAQRTSANQLAVQWAGNTSTLKTVYIALLDANRQPLQQKVITQQPVQASLALTPTARYYGVQVVFANGTSNTMIAPIR
jgi:hypothetical protein